MATFGYKIIGPDGRESEPFDSNALVSHARMGHVQPGTHVFDPTVGQWLLASQVNALAALNAGLQQPPPPMPGQYPASPQARPFPGLPDEKPPLARPMAIAIGIGVGLLIAFSAFGIKQLASAKKSVKTNDGLYAMSVPILWSRHTVKFRNMVEYAGAGAGNGVVVYHLTLRQGNTDDLNRMTASITQVTERNLNVSSLYSQPVPTTAAGYPATQFELDDDGHIGFHRYRKTLIATPDGIYDVTLFTREANAVADRPKQDAILASFHRVSPPQGAAQ